MTVVMSALGRNGVAKWAPGYGISNLVLSSVLKMLYEAGRDLLITNDEGNMEKCDCQEEQQIRLFSTIWHS